MCVFFKDYKLQLHKEAIADCQKCLQLDPVNIKARLRLAEATRAYGNRKEVRRYKEIEHSIVYWYLFVL